MIQVETITKRYGTLTAVDEVSITIGAGEIYSLVGANGAGKSTLMRILVGITEADAGRVLICGEDLAHRLPTTKHHIGYLPEELLFYDLLTGSEYLRLVAGLKEIPGLKETDNAQIAEELEFFGIAHAADKLVGGYSLGMRKKLGLCAAMLGSPDILVLDEPLNGLDVEMMRKLRHRLEEERSRGKAILVSSHVMSFVERVSDRVGVMRGGKLVAEGSAADLRRQTGLIEEDFEDVFFTLAE